MDMTSFFTQIRQTSEGFQANCPKCNDTEKKFYYNVEKGVGCCFHSECSWYKDRGGVTERRLTAYFSGTGIIAGTPEIIESSPEADVKLPKEFKLIEDLKSDLRETLLAYLEHRGFTKKIVYHARIGYCEKGEFWGYLIFPVFENGEVMWWQGRRFKNRNRKFYNPESSKKSELLYRVGKQKRPKSIVLVESITNALTLETTERTRTLILGLLGKSMSEIQCDKILMYERWADEVIVALDADARRDAIAIADRLLDKVPSVKIPMFPEDQDINELGRLKSWELIWKAPVFRRDKRIEFIVGGKYERKI